MIGKLAFDLLLWFSSKLHESLQPPKEGMMVQHVAQMKHPACSWSAQRAGSEETNRAARSRAGSSALLKHSIVEIMRGIHHTTRSEVAFKNMLAFSIKIRLIMFCRFSQIVPERERWRLFRRQRSCALRPKCQRTLQHSSEQIGTTSRVRSSH